MKLRFCLILVSFASVQAQVLINSFPSREFGQTKLVKSPTSGAPNLIEGRELNSPSSIAFDTSTNPPIVYVADTGNNRVLAWKNATTLTQSNPAPLADLVIGQYDFASNQAGGPGVSGYTTGLAGPTGVAVDAQGNVYVADNTNNRILRFPQPFAQGNSGALLQPDLVIGQISVSSGNSPNQGQNTPSAQTLAFNSNPSGGCSPCLPVGMVFDGSGNLWVTDILNNRVLRFPASQLTANQVLPTADTVLGQASFSTNAQANSATGGQLSKANLANPTSLAFDSMGNLYVCDQGSRVLLYTTLSTGASASRVLGINPAPAAGQQPAPYPNASTLGEPINGSLFSAQCVVTIQNYPMACDTFANRLVRYDLPANWPAETATVPSPQAADWIGQPNLTSGQGNENQIQPSGTSLLYPVSAGVNGNSVWIVDQGNNRVVAFPTLSLASRPGGFSFGSANQLLGQVDYKYNSPNLIEGKEVWFNSNGQPGAGMVVDYSSTPPHLYIADTLNNRVLGFKDARAVGTDAHTLLTQKADLVIGQPDLYSALPNYSPSNQLPTDEQRPNSTGLLNPAGLAVDAAGNLYVADAGNGRVLRFPAPFAQPAGLPTANLVLGQLSFTSKITDPSKSSMHTPYGLAILSAAQNGSLVVSDSYHNRVLVFQKAAGGDFQNGEQASIVLGQQDFISQTAGSSASQLSAPKQIAADTSDRLYVADSGNNRVEIFSGLATGGNGQPAALQITGLNSPYGVAVSALSGEVWVANTNGDQILGYPRFETLQLTQTPNEQIASPLPLSIALDTTDNLIVGEAINRVSFYFPRMYYRNAANYAAGDSVLDGSGSPEITPGMLTLLGRYGQDFALTPAGVQALPWPTTLNDIEVTVNGEPAPIYALDSNVVRFQVPNDAPQNGPADFVVLQVSTQQILAATTFNMRPAAPGLFTQSQDGTGPAAATNQDGTVNSASNPAPIGSVITLWLDGAGYIPNLPGNGVAPGAALSTLTPPQVVLNGIFQGTVLYSGTSPQYPGLWQLNVQIPKTTPGLPPGPVSVLVFATPSQIPSNTGGTSGGPFNGPGDDHALTVSNNLVPLIYVK